MTDGQNRKMKKEEKKVQRVRMREWNDNWWNGNWWNGEKHGAKIEKGGGEGKERGNMKWH